MVEEEADTLLVVKLRSSEADPTSTNAPTASAFQVYVTGLEHHLSTGTGEQFLTNGDGSSRFGIDATR